MLPKKNNQNNITPKYPFLVKKIFISTTLWILKNAKIQYSMKQNSPRANFLSKLKTSKLTSKLSILLLQIVLLSQVQQKMSLIISLRIITYLLVNTNISTTIMRHFLLKFITVQVKQTQLFLQIITKFLHLPTILTYNQKTMQNISTILIKSLIKWKKV